MTDECFLIYYFMCKDLSDTLYNGQTVILNIEQNVLVSQLSLSLSLVFGTCRCSVVVEVQMFEFLFWESYKG